MVDLQAGGVVYGIDFLMWLVYYKDVLVAECDSEEEAYRFASSIYGTNAIRDKMIVIVEEEIEC